MKEGWTYKKLGEVCRIFGRIGFRGYTKADLVDSPNDGAITLSPSNIVNGEMDYSKCSYITWAKYEESPEIMIYPGDILLVKTASVGKTALVKDLPHKATINPQFVVFKNIEISHEYLSYYLKSEKAQIYIWSVAKGAAAQTISQKNLAAMQVPVPKNISEQQAIVSRLDATFAQIDELKANAEKQLTEARALFQKALEEAMTPKEGWEKKRLKKLAAKLFAGGDVPKESFSKTQTPQYCIPIVSNGIENNGLYGYTEFARVNEPAVTISGRGTIGYIVERKSPFFPIIRLITIIPHLEIIGTRFLYYALRNIDFSHSGSSIPQLTVPMVKDLEISLPPLSEQQAIVSRLDALSESVRRYEEIQRKTITECDALKQALLREIFEG